MSVFVVRYTHPDVAGWHQHLEAHSKWLLRQLADGILKASGPLVDPPAGEHGALLVFAAKDRTDLDDLLATDPYAVEGLVSGLEVVEWNPLFGAFQPDSSLPMALQHVDWAPFLAGMASSGGPG